MDLAASVLSIECWIHGIPLVLILFSPSSLPIVL